jgi:putative salt-induced outer membrane protein
MLSRIITSLTLALSVSCLASVALAKEDVGWTGEVALNGAKTTGNNDTTDVGLAFKVNKRTADWRHSLRGTTDFGRNQGNTNKRRYRLGYKIGRDLAPRIYSFANLDYYSDDFGAFKNGYFVGGGAGYSIRIDKPTLWRLEAGAGYRSQKARLKAGDPSGLAGRKEAFASARVYSDLEHHFNERVSLTNDTEIFYSDVDTFLTNELGVTSQMFESLSLRASFRVETHTDVPVGRETTDTISRIGIVYTVK